MFILGLTGSLGMGKSVTARFFAEQGVPVHDADAVVVVSAPPEVQRARVLERPGMTVEKLEAILAKQMPDDEKRRRADFIVDTSRGFEAARAEVRAILDAVATMPKRRR